MYFSHGIPGYCKEGLRRASNSFFFASRVAAARGLGGLLATRPLKVAVAIAMIATVLLLHIIHSFSPTCGWKSHFTDGKYG